MKRSCSASDVRSAAKRQRNAPIFGILRKNGVNKKDSETPDVWAERTKLRECKEDEEEKKTATASLPLASSAAPIYTTYSEYLSYEDSPEMRSLLARAGITQDQGLAAQERYLRCQPLKPLWPSQIQGCDFMREREIVRVHGCGGGIVADEMGTGKTLQTLAFILQSLQERFKTTRSPFGAPTLIVAPKTLYQQWRDEIDACFPPHAFSVAVVGDSRRECTLTAEQILREYNLVITTYPTVLATYTALLQQKQAGGSEKSKGRLSARYAVLYETPWHRIVADEGHLFSNSETKYYKAMCQLRAHHKWILTGTPILNDIDSVCNEMRFVGIEESCIPSDASLRFERVKGTHAEQKQRRRGIDESAETARLSLVAQVRDLLWRVMLRRTDSSKSFQRSSLSASFETTAELLLYGHYYARFCETCKRYRAERLKRKAQKGSKPAARIEADSDTATDPREESTGGEKRLSVVQLVTVEILRLRQLCVAPCIISQLDLPERLLLDRGYSEEQRRSVNTDARILAHTPSGAPRLAYLAAARLLLSQAPKLPRTESEVEERSGVDMRFIYMECSRRTLLQALLDKGGDAALERLSLILRDVRERILPSFSTKVRHFVRQVLELPSDDKSLVFSEWVEVLRAVGAAFQRTGIPHMLLTGELSTVERAQVLRDFDAHRGRCCLLVSLQVGNIGLNIPCANHVFIANPWWNPQTEAQAIFRVMRPGQTKQTHVYSTVMRQTVEEDVMRMSWEKQCISDVLLCPPDRESSVPEPDLCNEGNALHSIGTQRFEASEKGARELLVESALRSLDAVA